MDFEDLPIPDELKNSIRNSIDLRKMHQMDHQNRVNNLLDDLSAEQLATLFSIIDSIHEDGRRMAAMWIGRLMETLRIKHGVCVRCLEKHDSMSDCHSGKTEVDVQVAAVSAPDMQKLFEEAQRISDPPLEKKEIDEQANMLEYGLEYSPEGEVRCANCKMPYRSVYDRTLRRSGPEGCEGCKHKAKFG